MSLRKKQNTKKSPQSIGPPSNNPPSASRQGFPEDVKSKLNEVFVMIEREFDTLYSENVACKFMHKIIIIIVS